MSDIRHFSAAEQLSDGTPMTVRAVRPEDKGRIKAAFRELEPETIYTRFFQHKAELTDEELLRATEVDFERQVTLVVTLGAGEDQTIIGGASYVAHRDASGTAGAEVSFTVEEDYQGKGMASILLRHLIRIARSKGLARFEAEVLAGNRSMLAVFSRSGLPMKTERLDDVVRVTLNLVG